MQPGIVSKRTEINFILNRIGSFFLFFILTGQKICLSQDPAAQVAKSRSAERVIEYKWMEAGPEDNLPFDDPFVWKITNIPSGVDTLSMTLFEIRGNYRLFKKNKNSITEDDFKKMPVIRTYYTKGWKRPKADTSHFANVPVLYPLKPNSIYVIKMEATEKLLLTGNAKEEVEMAIKESQLIRDLLTKYAKGYLSGSKKKFAELTSFKNELNQSVIKELKDINEKYTFEPPADEEDQLRAVNKFILAILNFSNKASELAEDTTLKNLSAFINLSGAIKKTALGEFVFDKTEQKKIDGIIRSIDSSKENDVARNEIHRLITSYQDITSSAEKLVTIIVENIVLNNTYILNVLGSDYAKSMTDQANNYIGLDMGLAYIGNFSRFHTYYGLNLYLRPVNKNIPLSRYKSFGDIFLTRTSILLGLTFSSVEKENIRKGILGDKGLILGAGFRILSFFRINGGGLIYYRYPTNPLQDPERYSAKVSPFVSLSFDLDVEELLGAVGKSIFPAKSPK